MTAEYGENGFIPTVENVQFRGNTLLMETIDPRPETNLVGREGEPLQRAGDLVTEEQQEVLALYDK